MRNILIILLVLWISNSVAQEISKADSLERAFLAIEDPDKKMLIRLELTNLILSSDPDRALELALQTVAMAEEHKNQKNKLLAWLQITEIYWSKTDYRSSMEMANKAKLLAVDLDMEKEYAEALIMIARNLCDLGEYKKSSELNFQALKIFEKLNDKKGIAKAFNRIGVDYYIQENYEKAFEYYSQSLAIARENNDLEGISRGLNNVAITNRAMGDYEHCLDNLLESVEIDKKIGRRIWKGINYKNLASIYKDKQNFDTTSYYLNKARRIFIELNNLTRLGSTYIDFSKLYSDIGNYDSSLYYANLAYEIGLENKLNRTVYDAAKQLHLIYFSKNAILNAYEYAMIEYRMKEELDHENSMTRLSQLELLYEFEKIEQENEIKQQRREIRFIVSGIIAILLIVLMVIIFVSRIRIRRKNEEIEKQKLKSELELRNKELTSNAMSLMKKNEVLSDIAGKLMDLRASAIKDETKFAIKKIVQELQKNKDNKIWEEFDMRFMQVHTDFYNKFKFRVS